MELDLQGINGHSRTLLSTLSECGQPLEGFRQKSNMIHVKMTTLVSVENGM